MSDDDATLPARVLDVIRAQTGGDDHALTRYVAVADELRTSPARLRDALRALETTGEIEWRSNGALRLAQRLKVRADE